MYDSLMLARMVLAFVVAALIWVRMLLLVVMASLSLASMASWAATMER